MSLLDNEYCQECGKNCFLDGMDCDNCAFCGTDNSRNEVDTINVGDDDHNDYVRIPKT